MENLPNINNLDDMSNHMGNFDSHRSYITESLSANIIRSMDLEKRLLPVDIEEKLESYTYSDDDNSVPLNMLDHLTSASHYADILLLRFQTEYSKFKQKVNNEKAVIEKAMLGREDKKILKATQLEKQTMIESSALKRIAQLPDEIVDVIKSYFYAPSFRLLLLSELTCSDKIEEGLMRMKKPKLFMLADKLASQTTALRYILNKTTAVYPHLPFMETAEYSRKTKFLNSGLLNKNSKKKIIADRIVDNILAFHLLSCMFTKKRNEYIIHRNNLIKLHGNTNLARHKSLVDILEKKLLRVYHTILYASRPEFNKRASV